MRLVRELFQRSGSEPAAPARQSDPRLGARGVPTDTPAVRSAGTPERAALPADTRLLAAVLAAATRHDAACVDARDQLRGAFGPGAPASDADLDAALDRSRRAMTCLCAELERTARDGTRHLLPFARQLVSTRAIEALDEDGRIALLRPLFDDERVAERRSDPSSDADARPDVTDARSSDKTATTMTDRMAISTDHNDVAMSDETDSGMTDPRALVQTTREAAERARQIAPETLFDHLLARREVISYQSAYAALLGPVAGSWRSLIHAPTVLSVARVTAPRSIAGLEMRLEGLVVNKKSARPGQRHFRQPGLYSEEDWVERFGVWELCQHSPAQIQGTDDDAVPEAASAGGTAV